MPATRKVSKSIKHEDVKPYDRPSSSPPSTSASNNKARGQLPDGSKASLARAVIAAGVKALTNEEAAALVSVLFHCSSQPGRVSFLSRLPAPFLSQLQCRWLAS